MAFKRSSIAQISIALLLLAMCVVAAGAKAKPAAAARGMLVGVFDPNRPFDTPDTTFPTLVNLRAQIIRVNLNWNEVATKRPLQPTDPADPAYDWSRYDQLMLNAKKYKIQVLFTIFGTPRWANGTKKGINRAPRQMAFLKYFATAAAKRYSGTYKRDDDTVAAGGSKVARLERAEQPGLPHAAVDEDQQQALHGRPPRSSTSASARRCGRACMRRS